MAGPEERDPQKGPCGENERMSIGTFPSGTGSKRKTKISIDSEREVNVYRGTKQRLLTVGDDRRESQRGPGKSILPGSDGRNREEEHMSALSVATGV